MIEIGVDFLRLVLGKGKFNIKHAVNDTNKELYWKLKQENSVELPKRSSQKLIS